MTRDKQYVFSQETEKELQILQHYLKRKRYSPSTITQHLNYAGLFIENINKKNVPPGAVNYLLIKDFIFQLRSFYGTNQINRILTAIGYYYDSLDLGFNPVAGLRLRGGTRTLHHAFIEYEELEALYNTYQAIDDRKKRNKVILGLIIYQGMTTAELHRLREQDILLQQGKVYIKGSKNTNGRILKLDVDQLLDLQEYIEEVRLRMLQDIERGEIQNKPGRKAKIDPKIYQQVFFSQSGSANIKTSLYHLFRAVKKVYPKIESGKVIRAAVIVEWLKHYDIRRVQYMAGHRFVSSTERYQAFILDDLEDSLEKYHPLK